MNFTEVSKIDEIPAGHIKSFVIDGKEILVVNYDGNYYAIGGKCTHMGGDLSKGRLDGKIVICPKHGSKFDVITGKCVAGPKVGFLKLKTKDETTYEVRVDGKTIKVNV